jgi:hypothetical protein
MPSPSPKKFILHIKSLREAVGASLMTAEQAVKEGESAVKAARKRAAKDRKDPTLRTAVKNNEQTLKDARKALRNLNDAVDALEDACCDQFLNCDPTYT